MILLKMLGLLLLFVILIVLFLGLFFRIMHWAWLMGVMLLAIGSSLLSAWCLGVVFAKFVTAVIVLVAIVSMVFFKRIENGSKLPINCIYGKIRVKKEFLNLVFCLPLWFVHIIRIFPERVWRKLRGMNKNFESRKEWVEFLLKSSEGLLFEVDNQDVNVTIKVI